MNVPIIDIDKENKIIDDVALLNVRYGIKFLHIMHNSRHFGKPRSSENNSDLVQHLPIHNLIIFTCAKLSLE